MKRIRGVDLSACQPLIDDSCAQAMKALGVEFAYIRCAIGNEPGIDVRCRAFAEVLKRNGIAVGPYFFGFPLPHLDAREQAHQHVRLADGLGLNVGELPPAFDLEWPPRETQLTDGSLENTWAKWQCSSSQIRDWGLEYLDEGVRLTGIRWPIYSFRYFLDCIQVDKAPEYAKHILWLADGTFQGIVPDDTQLARLSVPRPWSELTIVQHDGNGGLRLPNGADADFNVMPGGIGMLRALCGLERANDVVLDLEPAKHEACGILIDEMIREYRQSRIDVVA